MINWSVLITDESDKEKKLWVGEVLCLVRSVVRYEKEGNEMAFEPFFGVSTVSGCCK